MPDIDLESLIEAHSETEEPEPHEEDESELKLGVMYPITHELMNVFNRVAKSNLDLAVLQAMILLSQDDVDYRDLGHTSETRDEYLSDPHYAALVHNLDLIYGKGGYSVAYDVEEEAYWLVVGEGIAFETTTDDLDGLTRGEVINVLKDFEDIY